MIGQPYLAITAFLAVSGAVGGIWLHGRSTGHDAAQAACEARIGEAQRQAMIEAAKATRQQRARAEALAVANQNLQRIADDLLAEGRNACPVDPDTRSRVLSIRPDYPDTADTAP
jgi:hypothetical protein